MHVQPQYFAGQRGGSRIPPLPARPLFHTLLLVCRPAYALQSTCAPCLHHNHPRTCAPLPSYPYLAWPADWKDLYLPHLRVLEAMRLMRVGGSIIADNVITPGACAACACAGSCRLQLTPYCRRSSHVCALPPAPLDCPLSRPRARAGAPEYLAYVRGSPLYATVMHDACLEYTPHIRDAVAVSTVLAQAADASAAAAESAAAAAAAAPVRAQ